jgi:hypothetical protein
MSAKLGDLIAEAEYSEMYGVELSAPVEEYITSPSQHRTIARANQTPEEKPHPSAHYLSSRSSFAQIKVKSTKPVNSC